MEYKWEKNIFDNELSDVPDWIKDLLLVKKVKKVKKTEMKKL